MVRSVDEAINNFMDKGVSACNNKRTIVIQVEILHIVHKLICVPRTLGYIDGKRQTVLVKKLFYHFLDS